jgi:hypothetical protein
VLCVTMLHSNTHVRSADCAHDMLQCNAVRARHASMAPSSVARASTSSRASQWRDARMHGKVTREECVRLCQLCVVQALLDDVPRRTTWSPRRSRSQARATVQYAESSSDARAALAGQPEATLLTAPPSPSASRRRCACESCTTVR